MIHHCDLCYRTYTVEDVSRKVVGTQFHQLDSRCYYLSPYHFATKASEGNITG